MTLNPFHPCFTTPALTTRSWMVFITASRSARRSTPGPTTTAGALAALSLSRNGEPPDTSLDSAAGSDPRWSYLYVRSAASPSTASCAPSSHALRRRALNTGDSWRGLEPMSRMTSAPSNPATVVLARYVERTSADSGTGPVSSSCFMLPEPRRLSRSFTATSVSASASLPAIALISLPCALPNAACTADMASAQEAGARPLAPLTMGTLRRWRLRPSYWKRALSLIHSSFTSSFRRGVMRMTSVPRLSTLMLAPSASLTSTLSVLLSSQLRAVNAYGLDVSAPTGHRSITLPDSSLATSFSTYVPISLSRPRPVTPSSAVPATSDEKRTHLVQWMQRFMTVLTRGPRFLSSTARLVSVNLLLSLPKIMAWSCRSHSPPWSQMGQSRGWLISKNSITPSRAFLTTGVLVLIFIPGPAGMAQEAWGLGLFSISTRHMRQLPAIERR
mmetsp:Transcript_29180/g.74461  ORF Transcript_29180/g.74461 Transcript_29180/m.74461 type:complete len:445 (+) Transcript_29180:1810-3144(+)